MNRAFLTLFSLSPMIVRFPPGTTRTGVGEERLDNRELAGRMARDIRPGSIACLPSLRDEHGQQLWDIEYPRPSPPHLPWPIACDLSDDATAIWCLRRIAADWLDANSWRVLCDRLAELGHTRQEAFFRELADGIDAALFAHNRDHLEAAQQESMPALLRQLFGPFAAAPEASP